MTSQVKGLEAAIRNAADAVSLTQTAEGALDEVSSILHRMRELSVQAANGVYTGQDRQALQNEVGQLQLELARIAEKSTFNAVKMLNGDFTNTAFQIGFQPGTRPYCPSKTWIQQVWVSILSTPINSPTHHQLSFQLLSHQWQAVKLI